jgi:hypothetical protein
MSRVVFDPEKITNRLRQCWSRRSSSQWSPENPARGQCNVTALLVNDRFGGEILKTPVADQWHYYNRVDGRAYDFTLGQFTAPPAYMDLPSNRTEAMSGTTSEQYMALSESFNLLD